MPHAADIAANLVEVRRRNDAAASRSRRDPAGVTLVAVSKTFDASPVRARPPPGSVVSVKTVHRKASRNPPA
jgi:uncharacterized pyridoxal phosphate-containing UPF0001 family protein